MGLASKYRIGSRLGGGGMAEVYLGSATGAEGFARTVAIKRVLPAYSGDEQFSRMFIEEARVCSQLAHANIVSVSDFDRDDAGQLMLVMELVEGKDLAALMATGMLPLPVVIYVVEQVLRGLGYAHELPHQGAMKGIVHRDVSPHNVLLSWQGAVKVSDFGIAKAWQTSQATGTLSLKGKPAYMSPEQARGEPLDGRSDLFAVGIMLFELITGQRLFGHGVSLEETLSRLFFQSIISPRQYRPDCPDDLANITLLLLERDKARRYPSARYVINDLLLCRDASPRGADMLAQLMAERFADAPGTAPVAMLPGYSGGYRHGNESAPAGATSQPWAAGQPAWQTPELWQPPQAQADVARMHALTEAVAPATPATRLERPRRPTSAGVPAARRRTWAVVFGAAILGGAAALLLGVPSTSSTKPRPGVITPSPAPLDVAPSVAEASQPSSETVPPAVDATPGIPLGEAPAAASVVPSPLPPATAAAKGVLRVITRPPSEVFMGRQHIGFSPLNNVPLAPGSYKVRLVGPENQSKTFSVRIKSRKTFVIDHTW
ncbi:MAG: protein kinase [Myxococcales bacterium]|nr:protein kinase [Myxococcales bacterium]